MTEMKNTGNTDAEEMQDTSGHQPPNYLTNKWTLIAFLLAVPLFFLFVYLGDQGKGRAAGIASFEIVLVIRSRWDLRARVWFWATVTFLILLHVPLILRTQWTNVNMPAVSLMPFAILDWVIMYGCIKLVEKVMKRS
ncbi:MAG TPA: hypothetical protein VN602_00550 [Gemmatimonadaceae bacterium]|nr:hypothetical protein [Gemmatimonadaceae bacterium]